ncbi:sperm acrosome membrane-associated protein 4-like [Notolabrus celidotus]|uniref:sperm acrosome membrane-associated protein 4-like n=1 Tax=Notolabrus celidotus TaxID=1203425 RepID=UPI0014902DA7|nr:sperm acrosome membrane-associated protein 4-like [Notolabrus celidotus]
MKGLIFCVFAALMLTPAKGEEEEPVEQLLDSVGLEHEEVLQCFHCELGFWDACYTTETNCSHKEVCFTGRGKAADTLDVKTLGCTKAEECGVESTVELFSNKTFFIMTKHCCDTHFCNSAHKLPINTLFHVIVALLTTWHLSDCSAGSQ